MARIVISGGGTGGHVYPAIGIARALMALDSQLEIFFIGGANCLESTVVPQHGFRFLPTSVASFPRELTWRWFPTIGKILRGFTQSLGLLSKLGPSVVVGTGGYVSGPVLFAASRLGIPTVIQEQNVVPGLTNRLLARWAKEAFIAFDAVPLNLPGGTIKVTGNPIRPEIPSCERAAATYQKLGLDANLKTVFVMGGSQGSHAINQAVVNALGGLVPYHRQLQLVHQTGAVDYKYVSQSYKCLPLNHLVEPYFDLIEEIYSITDLMVCRAGGMTVSEVTACGLPAVFIPLPAMAGNKQELNARVVADVGGAVVLSQQFMTGTLLAAEISEIIRHSTKQGRMADASRKLGKPHASEEIATSILSLINNCVSSNTQK